MRQRRSGRNMSSRRRHGYLAQDRGVGLLELLMAVAISGIVFAAVCDTWARFAQRFRVQHVISGLRQELRVGVDVLSSELRLAGTGSASDEPAFLRLRGNEVAFQANLSSLQTVVTHPAQSGQRDLLVENGSGWPEGKRVMLCSIDGCWMNRLARTGRSGSLSLAQPLLVSLPAGSAVSISNHVRYYLGRDEAGLPRVMRDVDGGISTLMSGVDVFRLEYFDNRGVPTTDSRSVARIRVRAGLRSAGSDMVREIGVRP